MDPQFDRKFPINESLQAPLDHSDSVLFVLHEQCLPVDSFKHHRQHHHQILQCESSRGPLPKGDNCGLAVHDLYVGLHSTHISIYFLTQQEGPSCLRPCRGLSERPRGVVEGCLHLSGPVCSSDVCADYLCDCADFHSWTSSKNRRGLVWTQWSLHSYLTRSFWESGLIFTLSSISVINHAIVFNIYRTWMLKENKHIAMFL